LETLTIPKSRIEKKAALAFANATNSFVKLMPNLPLLKLNQAICAIKILAVLNETTEIRQFNA
jgi:hypothetical protein